MDHFEYIGRILGVRPEMLSGLDGEMQRRTGRAGVIERVAKENERAIKKTLQGLSPREASAPNVKKALREIVVVHERRLLDFLETIEGENEFERAANLARKMTNVSVNGFFLRREHGKEILGAHKPENLLKFLGAQDIEEVLSKHDITEVFSVLRFIESDAWMHKTFDVAYSRFTPDDFEERDIEIKVLGPEWRKIAEQFVAKKHHNLSHLKEFGVIFINPIKENVPGKFLRDFALILHYFHEISFYSDLFRKYSGEPDFAEKFKALLRGDVKEAKVVAPGEWLIVQQYLAKNNPEDKRLFLPRVNPESVHWMRGERDLTSYAFPGGVPDFSSWFDMDWVADMYGGELVSFDLEDNAMSLVSFGEQVPGSFSYHQKEALWTKIFFVYAGGEAAAEKLLIEHFSEGVIKF